MKKETPFHIALDGPLAAGKGTVSRLTAERLGFLYIDTGAMYRMVALLALQNNVSLDDEDQLVELISQAKMDMRNPSEEESDGRLITVLLNGEDVSWKIRTEEVSAGSSKVAQYARVRELLVKKQQEIAATQNVVMEGRDITFKVLPHAQIKIFLTASDIVRAKRRHQQLLAKGQDVTLDEVYRDLIERDQRDSTREVDPLHIVPDAWIIDASDLSIDEVVELITGRVKALIE